MLFRSVVPAGSGLVTEVSESPLVIADRFVRSFPERNPKIIRTLKHSENHGEKQHREKHREKHSEKHSEINVGKPEKSKGFLWRSMVTGSG